jgi:hypothetical protein
MPRYFFDVRDGEGFVKDDEGMELLDIAEAQIEAAETLADKARDLAVRAADPLGHPMAIEVREWRREASFPSWLCICKSGAMPEPTLPEPFLEHSFYSNVARRMTL